MTDEDIQAAVRCSRAGVTGIHGRYEMYAGFRLCVGVHCVYSNGRWSASVDPSHRGPMETKIKQLAALTHAEDRVRAEKLNHEVHVAIEKALK
jgi:hypothetical protein